MNIGITSALIVVFVLMLIMPYFSQRKSRQEYVNMLSGLKVGDMVKTGGGIIGKITKITDKGEVKTIVLETGSKTNKSYLELDISMVYCVLKKSTTKTEETEEISAETEDIVEESKPAQETESIKKEETSKPKTRKSTTSTKKSTKTTKTKKD